jgi:hypothetical protein
VRYDPAYFSPSYAERYATPGAAAKDLEFAIQSADQALLAELLGQRFPARIESSQRTEFVQLWERTDQTVTYLYLDQSTFERRLIAFQQVRGRWVVVPPGPYQYLRSGKWQPLFLPVAATWWLLAGLGLVVAQILRHSVRFRAWLEGEPSQGQPGET